MKDDNIEKTQQLSISLTETIKSSELTKVSGELIEVGIDSILKNGLLKDIPVISVLSGIWKTGVAIRDYRFSNKLLLFLHESSKLPLEKRLQLIEDLEDNDFQKEAGEKLIAIIDNIESSSKAILIGKLLNLFGQEIITKNEFWRVSFIIEKLPTSDILALKGWKNIDLNKVEHIRKHLYLSVGLGWFVLDISSTGFVWTERLCEIISEDLLK
ncbi:hypothetical protein SAMN05660845_2378 [Flavobacterium swingsii]|uniref:DUF4393 domain-containing protein n=1 Tax=Flavobacterium swingsii TaxID=498292 RepID=A0A1I0ZRE4_9FLAO|nr:hypothetical protein [Flavobacterium swingsii]SFB28107.1 hypothetical protein SAMN05660845_2378 [Flavobacterium swingsii]